MASALLCEAIQGHRLLAFDYNGLSRVVAPYAHGFIRSGEALRAIQVRGGSSSGLSPEGKLWTVSKMRAIQLLDEAFSPDDPHYNPDDSAMLRIHCRI